MIDKCLLDKLVTTINVTIGSQTCPSCRRKGMMFYHSEKDPDEYHWTFRYTCHFTGCKFRCLATNQNHEPYRCVGVTVT